jgi:two-component system, chemotaxis family, protein-glutamate methylesterase/glutaminase
MAACSNTKDLGVLVVDDSAVYRKILKDVLEDISGVAVKGVAPNGRIALEKIKTLLPDVVLLDVEMPEMNGLETLEAIRRTTPKVGVIMVSGVGRNAVEVTVEALERGALDFVTKPDGESREVNHKSLVERLTPILMNVTTKLAVEKVRQRHEAISDRFSKTPASPAATEQEESSETGEAREARDRTDSASVPAPGKLPARVDVVVVGISTGGPNALGVMIPELPADLGVPVLVVQHMPPVFTASLAKSLNGKARLQVSEAREGEIIAPNHVYIAPGGFHMVVRRRIEDSRPAVGLNENPPENSCRPAVDVLFRSVAAIYGSNVLSVIMTGMGQDGLNGVRSLKQRGAYSLIQDEASSTIYGMPLAVFKAGLSDESLPLCKLASRIVAIVKSVV